MRQGGTGTNCRWKRTALKPGLQRRSIVSSCDTSEQEITRHQGDRTDQRHLEIRLAISVGISKHGCLSAGNLEADFSAASAKRIGPQEGELTEGGNVDDVAISLRVVRYLVNAGSRVRLA